VSIRIDETSDGWEYDIRWLDSPAQRSTGTRPTLLETLDAVREEVLAHG